ncbi:MAG: aromatic ring-hydroxylating dioxygenase subunit alpha, partial [Emcibacter sp.]|nr:aromatic ring-hydroxylating dioxygenase subunit alpha [Emcibacter sp.]
MFINFRYPACLSEELTERPLKVMMLGCNFALFRDSEGTANCLSNTCIHRGGSLACQGDETPGKVIGDNIQCPYHGWQFDKTGDCVKIPSRGKEAKIPPRAKIDAYPVQEKYGIIFVFLGDLPEDERPPLLDAEEYDQEGWACNIQTYDLNTSYQRSIENAIDPAHNEFVHPTHGFSGERDDYMVPKLDLIEEEWGVGFMADYESSGTPDQKYGDLRDKQTTRAGSGTFGPSQFWTKIHPSAKFHMHQYTYDLPIDENRTRVFLVNMRNAGLDDEMGARLRARDLIVAQQDIDILDEVEPSQTPWDNTKEFMMPADSCIIKYRSYLKDYEKKGWRIDVMKMNAERNSGKIVHAI